MTDILAFGAHPDDVELSAAGSLIYHMALGHSVALVDLTAGELGTRGSAELRAEEASKSAALLGISKRVILGLKDGFLGSEEASLLKVVEVIRHFQPRIVLANAVNDRHPDHAQAAALVSKACFLAGLRRIETSYEGKAQAAHKTQAVYHYIQERYIQPDFVVDITTHFNKKMEAVKAFGSQFFNPGSDEPSTKISSENYLHFLDARAREMGNIIGCTYGEGFTVERTPGIKNLLDLL